MTTLSIATPFVPVAGQMSLARTVSRIFAGLSHDGGHDGPLEGHPDSVVVSPRWCSQRLRWFWSLSLLPMWSSNPYVKAPMRA
jgi:hypothetical protein